MENKSVLPSNFSPRTCLVHQPHTSAPQTRTRGQALQNNKENRFSSFRLESIS